MTDIDFRSRSARPKCSIYTTLKHRMPLALQSIDSNRITVDIALVGVSNGHEDPSSKNSKDKWDDQFTNSSAWYLANPGTFTY